MVDNFQQIVTAIISFFGAVLVVFVGKARRKDDSNETKTIIIETKSLPRRKTLKKK